MLKTLLKAKFKAIFINNDNTNIYYYYFINFNMFNSKPNTLDE